MADNNINKLINTTMAGNIAKELDKKDGAEDGKIKASVWNEFIESIGTGKKINSEISVENALKSITTYAVRLAHGTAQTATQLAKQWKDSIVANITGQAASSSAAPVGEAPPAAQTGNQKCDEMIKKAKDMLAEVATMSPKPNVKIASDYAEICLPDNRCITVHYREDGSMSVHVSYDTTPDVKSDGTTSDYAEVVFAEEYIFCNTDHANDTFTDESVKSNAKEFKAITDLIEQILEPNENIGEKLYDEVKGVGSAGAPQMIENSINKYNAANVISEFNKLSADSGESITEFLQGESALYRSHVIKPAKEYLNYVKEFKPDFAESQEYKDLEAVIADYEANGGSKRAVKVDQAIAKLMRKANLDLAIQVGVPKGTNDKDTVQKTFDGATNFLWEVANMNPKPEVKKGHNTEKNCDWANVILPDGRWIQVLYDKNGEISDVWVSHDSTQKWHKADGATFDIAEVMFKKDKAWYETYQSNDKYEGNITSGYDFEAIKEVAKMIVG